MDGYKKDRAYHIGIGAGLVTLFVLACGSCIVAIFCGLKYLGWW